MYITKLSNHFWKFNFCPFKPRVSFCWLVGQSVGSHAPFENLLGFCFFSSCFYLKVPPLPPADGDLQGSTKKRNKSRHTSPAVHFVTPPRRRRKRQRKAPTEAAPRRALSSLLLSFIIKKAWPSNTKVVQCLSYNDMYEKFMKYPSGSGSTASLRIFMDDQRVFICKTYQNVALNGS